MTRRLLMTCTLAWILVLRATPANAGYWTWLEEFSAVRDRSQETTHFFTPRCAATGSVTLRFARDRDLEVVVAWPAAQALTPRWCFYYDAKRAQREPSRGFAGVEVTTREIGGSVPLADNLIEIGAGIGGM